MGVGWRRLSVAGRVQGCGINTHVHLLNFDPDICRNVYNVYL